MESGFYLHRFVLGCSVFEPLVILPRNITKSLVVTQ